MGGSPNAFSYTLNENTKEGNYDISVIPGQLTVTNRQAQYQVTVGRTPPPATRTTALSAATGLKTSEFTVDGQKYTVEGLNTSDPKAVNAGEICEHHQRHAVVKDANGNDVSSQFAVTLVPSKLEIAKRSVTLTSASESRVYNGEALTNDGVTVGGDNCCRRGAVCQRDGHHYRCWQGGELVHVYSALARTPTSTTTILVRKKRS